ncbi:MAG: outer membrane protein [uncultured bacterium]|nr:MAG: outer membrane protein [uncultured bacterium]
MKHSSILYIVALSVLSSCMAPKYEVPHHPMPEKFKNQSRASRCEPMGQWWEQFNDPILNALIKQALKSNYELRIALEKIEESREFYNQRRANLFPVINIGSDVSRVRVSKALDITATLPTISSFYSLGLDSFWELDVWGKLRNAKNAQYYLFQAQVENMRDIYIMLIAQVAREYILATAFANRICILKNRIAIDSGTLTLLKDLFHAGLVSQISVAQQEQVLATSQDLLKASQTDLIQSKNQIALLLGVNPEAITIPLAKRVPLSHVRVATGIPSDLIRRRPDIRQVERELASSNESVGQAIAEWFPSFCLLGGMSSESSKGSSWFTGKSLAWNIGPSIQWPLINFGRIKANIKAKESVKRQTALRYSQAIIRALKEVEDFLAAYFNTLTQYDIVERQLQQAQLQEQLIKAQYESGLASYETLLSAQKNTVNTELVCIQVQQNMSENVVSLYKALGGGW